MTIMWLSRMQNEWEMLQQQTAQREGGVLATLSAGATEGYLFLREAFGRT